MSKSYPYPIHSIAFRPPLSPLPLFPTEPHMTKVSDGNTREGVKSDVSLDLTPNAAPASPPLSPLPLHLPKAQPFTLQHPHPWYLCGYYMGLVSMAWEDG